MTRFKCCNVGKGLLVRDVVRGSNLGRFFDSRVLAEKRCAELNSAKLVWSAQKPAPKIYADGVLQVDVFLTSGREELRLSWLVNLYHDIHPWASLGHAVRKMEIEVFRAILGGVLDG